MFQEFVLPELRESAKHQEYNLYHLDGKEQIRHLDDILSIPQIRMIQWVSVVGQPSYIEYIPVFQKIQKAGKGILINDVIPKDIEILLENLKPEGLFIVTSAESQDDADAILKMAKNYGSMH